MAPALTGGWPFKRDRTGPRGFLQAPPLHPTPPHAAEEGTTLPRRQCQAGGPLLTSCEHHRPDTGPCPVAEWPPALAPRVHSAGHSGGSLSRGPERGALTAMLVLEMRLEPGQTAWGKAMRKLSVPAPPPLSAAVWKHSPRPYLQSKAGEWFHFR